MKVKIRCFHTSCKHNSKTNCTKDSITISYDKYVDDDHMGINVDEVFKCDDAEVEDGEND